MADNRKKLSLVDGLAMLKSGMDTVTYDQKNLSNHIIFIETDQLYRGDYQPRRYFDNKALSELAQSIKQQGILQPVLVRKNKEKYELISGERRWQAAKLAGLRTIPAIIKNVDNETLAAFSLIENIQREDLNVLEEAEAYQRLIDDFELTHDDVAERVGKPRATITNFLRLLRLEPAVKQWLTEKKLTMGHTKVLLGLSGDQQIRVGGIVVKKGLSVRQTEVMVRSVLSPKEKVALSEEVLSWSEVMSEDLSELLGRPCKITLHKKAGAGQGSVRFDFASMDELSEFYEFLASKLDRRTK